MDQFFITQIHVTTNTMDTSLSQKYTDRRRPINTYLLNVFLHLLQWKGLSFALCVLIWYRSPGELVNTLSQPSYGQYSSFWPLGPISTCPLLYSNISLGAFGFINMLLFGIVWSKCFSHSPSNKNKHWKCDHRKVGDLFGNFHWMMLWTIICWFWYCYR